jgi:glycosyltransferase involved in cell wall biosynthesis
MPDVLQLSPRLPFPLDDGGRLASWQLSRCLRHNGSDIDLVCYAPDPQVIRRYADELDAVFRRVDAIPLDMERQYPLILLGALATGESYFIRKFRRSAYARAIQKRLEQRSYDVVLIDGAFPGVHLPVVARYRHRIGKIVVRAHNVEFEILDRLATNERSPARRALLRREAKRFRRFELDLLGRVDRVYTITDRDADTFSAAGVQTPMETIPPFIDIDRYRRDPGVSTVPRTIVHVGSMSWMPNLNGIDWFLGKVWPQIIDAFPDVKLYLVGKNPPPRLSEYDDKRVIVTGYVEDEKPHIQSAHLFIVPLFEGSGIRIKILTAMALGVPVLSTTIGAEGNEWPGLLVADEPDAWAELIRKHLAREPGVCDSAIAYVRENHDWRRPLTL